jgi:CHAD domain-containing protein
MSSKPALRPRAAIAPAIRAAAAAILARARKALTDPEVSDAEAVHQFRRTMKQWRAMMRLLQPFVPDATAWRRQGRDHARTLGQARDGQAALNALKDLVKQGAALPERSIETIRTRLEGIRAVEEQAALTPELRSAILAWIDAADAAIERWPLDCVEFAQIAAELARGYRTAQRLMPENWAQATAEELHEFRQSVVTHRNQMDLVEPLWPRHTQMWTEEAERLRDRLGHCQDIAILLKLAGPHQPLAHWRFRLAPACADRTAEHVQRAGRIARRLFAERPKAVRQRLETLWENGD